MRILVTGAAGCIGTNLCLTLLKRKLDVIGVDNFITGERNNLNPLLLFPKFKFSELDICKTSFVKRELSDISHIYHLACPTGVENLTKLAEEMLLTCSIGTKNVLELAGQNRASVVFTSSSEVYGDPKVSPQRESYSGNVDPLGIRSPYEEGKRYAESLALMYAHKFNVNVKIARLFNTYGPYMSHRDTRVIPRFLKQAITNKVLTVKGKGKQTRTFCYVDDLVDGLILLMKRGKSGEVYNIGSNKEISIVDLSRLVIKATSSKSKIKFVSRPAHDHQGRLPDLTKIKSLGWHQKVTLYDGLLKTIKITKTI